MFRPGEVTNEDCQWTGNPRNFQQLGNLTGGSDCQEEALELVLEWQKAMMWAALEGSALAGRPLRMTTCGISSDNVIGGYEAGNAQNPPSHEGYIGYRLTDRLTEWANENQMYFSMHIHYIAVEDATEAINKLVDTYGTPGSPWDTPNWRISTEIGATADFDNIFFTANNDANYTEYKRYFFDFDGHPSQYWEVFVEAWEDGQFFGDVEFDTVFDLLAASDFGALCYSAAQFDPGSEGNPSPYLIEALRATQLRLPQYTHPDNRTNFFTPLKGYYETAGSPYEITSFAPHDEACNEDDVCEDCDP
jgi:hypothetical protein